MGSRKASLAMEQQLVEMGFEKGVVTRALERSTFTSLNRATEWIINNQDSLSRDAKLAAGSDQRNTPQQRHEAPQRQDAAPKRAAPPCDGPPSKRAAGSDEANGGGGKSIGMAKIMVGAHSGKEASVLHMGNGWVRLQLADGSQMNLRAQDLQMTLKDGKGSSTAPASTAARRPASPSGRKAPAAASSSSARHVHPLKARCVCRPPAARPPAARPPPRACALSPPARPRRLLAFRLEEEDRPLPEAAEPSAPPLDPPAVSRGEGNDEPTVAGDRDSPTAASESSTAGTQERDGADALKVERTDAPDSSSQHQPAPEEPTGPATPAPTPAN